MEHGVQWIPEAALDVIHYTLMTDPVVAEDDQTCEAALDFIAVACTQLSLIRTIVSVSFYQMIEFPSRRGLRLVVRKAVPLRLH